MVAPSSINVTLTPELEKFVRDQIATGQYGSESEVLLEALSLFEEQEAERDFIELKAKLERAAAESDGEVFFTPEQSRQQLEEIKRLRALRNQ